MNDLANMKTDEWLEPDGLGGFASGTVSGIRTRRYHALLLTATKPPSGRVVLVNGFDSWVETGAGTFSLSSQSYNPDVVHPDGAQRIEQFKADLWPQWIYALEDGTKIHFELFACNGASVTVLAWRILTRKRKAILSFRPFLSGRDYHSMHHENGAFRFEPQIQGKRVVWHPYTGLPGIIALSNGKYFHQPDWYRNFLYEQERARGLDFAEDLAAPGAFSWDLSRGEAVCILAAEGFENGLLTIDAPPEKLAVELRRAELRRRQKFSLPLDRSADAYLVKRGAGKTIVAGYPWFTDWGRDTFIALRGLCLATERLDEARDILLEWAGVVSEGMLPNRFPDQGDEPEYNSVDASLWYIIAVHEFLQSMKDRGEMVSPWQEKALQEAVEAILTGYSRGTRYGIRMDQDGLLAAGVPGVQLTWMDAKIDDWVVTPRVGKPVEVQALWLNALWIASHFSGRWKKPFALGQQSFCARFWNEKGGYLYDVVDVNHQAGTVDALFRPNQILAIGGLPISLVAGERAERVVEMVTQRLWTPLGLRSLAPGEPGYTPRYEGGVRERDGVYHQGTVWPWLIGPFVEAWVRVHGESDDAKLEARTRFLTPILEHLDKAGLGHVSEIADAEPPHMPRGCPFQAWSLAEAMRLDRVVLAAVEEQKRASSRLR
ncbi:MAG: glycogen debranching enzyme family protein [Deltaproteobacteria bacterium]|nr:glycogen debranching enzyme family protein [Deltaproteobacteria bacterium]